MKRLLILLLFAIFSVGCAQTPPPAPAPPEEKLDWSKLPHSPRERQLAAIAGFENKSTYSADRLWDTSAQILASYLLKTGYFRVVEWEKMKQLFDWDALSHADLVKSPENLKKAHRILLCEYFISGSITYFDVSEHAMVSATSKNKTIDTTVRVDLLMQSAKSGEYLSAGTGEYTVSQVFSGGLSGGQTGSWSPRAADKALDMAIGKALIEMIANFDRNYGHSY